MNGTDLRGAFDALSLTNSMPEASIEELKSVPFGSGVSNFKIPVLKDLGSHASRKIRRPSQPIRKVLSAAWKLIKLPQVSGL